MRWTWCALGLGIGGSGRVSERAHSVTCTHQHVKPTHTGTTPIGSQTSAYSTIGWASMAESTHQQVPTVAHTHACATILFNIASPTLYTYYLTAAIHDTRCARGWTWSACIIAVNVVANGTV